MAHFFDRWMASLVGIDKRRAAQQLSPSSTPAERSRSAQFLRMSVFLAWTLAGGVVLFGLFRLAYLLHYGTHVLKAELLPDVVRAFTVGLRFDLKVLTILLSPLLLGALLGLAIRSARYHRVLFRLATPWVFLVLALSVILMTIDHFFYTYFDSHINVLIFGFFEDDTIAVLKSVRSDYPWIPALIGLALLSWGLHRGLRRLQRMSSARSVTSRFRVLLVCAVVVVYVGAARGSLGHHPLGIENVDVSRNEFVNLLAWNGVYALYEAINERNNVLMNTDPDEALQRYGYRTPAEAAHDYLGAGVDPAASDSEIVERLFAVTPEHPVARENPPHVIVIQMEQMGLHLLDLHGPRTNLLGRLERHLDEGFVFRRFLPATNGTASTLEALLVSSPVSPLSQSPYRYGNFESSAVLPFKRAGYETLFLTSGSHSWRNLNQFLPRIGFDEVLGRGAIGESCGDCEFNEWGVFDHHLFDYALETLRERDAAGKRVFMMLLTTSNHTPHMLPESYDPYDVELPPSIRDSLIPDPQRARTMLELHQYVNDALGKLMDDLQEGGLDRRVIVAATGDHSYRGLLEYRDEGELLQKHGVPLYLHVPQAYREGIEYDPSRFGSHRDIFPTLFARALSQARYFNSGNDLLAPDLPLEQQFALHEFTLALDAAGAVRHAPTRRYFAWQDDRLVALKHDPDDSLRALERRSRGYTALLNWYLRDRAIADVR